MMSGSPSTSSRNMPNMEEKLYARTTSCPASNERTAIKKKILQLLKLNLRLSLPLSSLKYFSLTIDGAIKVLFFSLALFITERGATQVSLHNVIITATRHCVGANTSILLLNVRWMERRCVIHTVIWRIKWFRQELTKSPKFTFFFFLLFCLGQNESL